MRTREVSRQGGDAGAEVAPVTVDRRRISNWVGTGLAEGPGLVIPVHSGGWCSWCCRGGFSSVSRRFCAGGLGRTHTRARRLTSKQGRAGWIDVMFLLLGCQGSRLQGSFTRSPFSASVQRFAKIACFRSTAWRAWVIEATPFFLFFLDLRTRCRHHPLTEG